MFGLSKKERVTEILRKRTKAVLIGGLFHAQDAEKYGLNEQASAYLYTEALVHQIYILILVFNNTFGEAHNWATPQFAWKVINEAITDYEMEAGGTLGSMTSFIFRRCAEIDNLSPQERVDGVEFWQSARKIAEFDSRTDQSSIANMLSNLSREYFDDIIKLLR